MPSLTRCIFISYFVFWRQCTELFFPTQSKDGGNFEITLSFLYHPNKHFGPSYFVKALVGRFEHICLCFEIGTPLLKSYTTLYILHSTYSVKCLNLRGKKPWFTECLKNDWQLSFCSTYYRGRSYKTDNKQPVNKAKWWSCLLLEGEKLPFSMR